MLALSGQSQSPETRRPQSSLGTWTALLIFLCGLALLLGWLAPLLWAQSSPRAVALPRNRYRNGEATLAAFAPISQATREGIVKLNVDGATVALGLVVNSNGLALTKASELKSGKLTCWLASEQEVPAEVLAVNEDDDLALVRVHARGLRPIPWATGDVAEGQWAITPGIAPTPHAVGVISALPHRIRPVRAFIGVQFDSASTPPRIAEVLAGLGAEKAGLKKDDVIQAINGATVTNRDRVVEILRDFRAGQTIQLRVQRNDQHFDAEVEMMPPPPNKWRADCSRSREPAA
jgi:S1-C subfamily serine protease